MKLKILPPTLRINNHYLTLDIKSEAKLDKDQLVSAIWYGCLRLYGESETSAFNLWLMRFYDVTNLEDKNSDGLENNNVYNEDIVNDNITNGNRVNDNVCNDNDKDLRNCTNLKCYHYKTVLRCQREYVDKVRGSLALLSNHDHKKIAISTIGICGTISSSIEKFIN